MTTTPQTLADLMGDYEKERLAEIEKEEAFRNRPDQVAKREDKRKSEFERGVRNGWWDKDGNPLTSSEDDESDEDADD